MTYFPSLCLYIHIKSQRSPILTTRPSSCNDATKYEHSIHLPNWKMTSVFWLTPMTPSVTRSLQQSNESSSLSYSTQKIQSYRFALYIPGQTARFRLGFPYMWNSFFWFIFCGYTVTQLVKEINLGDIERTWVVIFLERLKFYTILDYVSCAQSPQLS